MREKNNTKIYSKPGMSAIIINGGEKNEILYFDRTVLVDKMDNIPHTLIGNADFDPFKLDDSLQQKICNVKIMILDFSLRAPNDKIQDLEENQVGHKLSMPLWLDRFTSLQFIRLQSMKVDNLLLLNNALIKHLIFKDVLIEDKAKVLAQISQLEHLKYIVHDNIFNEQESSYLKEKLPNILILLETEYYQRVKRGEIML